MNRQRIFWIDWMKVIGMYLIITGHLFPVGYTFIYVFSVPLFFLISGFLCKQEQSHLVFWLKIFYNYITPIFIIRTIMYFWEKYISVDPNHFMSIFDYWLFMLKGYQNCIGACWFIYTLIIIRVLFQYFHSLKATILIFLFLTGIAIYLNTTNIHRNNAIINTTVAYQPFALGYYLRQYKNRFISFHPSFNTAITIIVFCSLLIVLCGILNGEVWLYNNGYGRSFTLYLIGAICGALLVYTISKLIDSQFKSIIYILSFGNIITLGFHQLFVNIIRIHFNSSSYYPYIWGLVILLVFYPIILFCKSYFPIILGFYHPTNNSDHDTKI